MQVLIKITPYNVMKAGLATTMVNALIENLSTLDKAFNRDQLIRNEICSTINEALVKNDLIAEFKASFFDQGSKSQMTNVLLNTLFKVQNFINTEKIHLLQTLGKNYPELLTYQWLK